MRILGGIVLSLLRCTLRDIGGGERARGPVTTKALSPPATDLAIMSPKMHLSGSWKQASRSATERISGPG